MWVHGVVCVFVCVCIGLFVYLCHYGVVCVFLCVYWVVYLCVHNVCVCVYIMCVCVCVCVCNQIMLLVIRMC